MEKRCFHSVETIRTGPVAGVPDSSDPKHIPSIPLIATQLQHDLLLHFASKTQPSRKEDVAENYSAFGGDGYALFLREGLKLDIILLVASTILSLSSICLIIDQAIFGTNTLVRHLYKLTPIISQILVRSEIPQLYQTCLSIHTCTIIYYHWLAPGSEIAALWCVLPCLVLCVSLLELGAEMNGLHTPISVDWKEIRFPYFHQGEGVKQHSNREEE